MSWKEKMKEYGGGDLAFLSEDGETLAFIVVGEPVLLKGRYKGRPSDKIGAPIITEDGFQLLVCGKRLARKISKYEDRFEEVAFLATRHGVQGDIESSYELTILKDADLTVKLVELKAITDLTGAVDEAVESAQAVMNA